MFDPNPYMQFGGAFHILGILVWGFFMLLVTLVLVAVIILLVRYLLVATRSHKLYIANNTPAEPVVVDEPVVPKRTPKAPPAV